MDIRLFKDKLRVWPWLLAACVATFVVGWIAPHQLGVLLWSLSKLCFGAYLGYWIDRSVFHYARPGDVDVRNPNTPTAYLVSACMVRRALIMAATILALGLGV